MCSAANTCQGRNDIVATKKKLNVGVIGLGIGRWHAGNFDDYGRSNLVAVCDQNEHLRQITVEKHSLPAENAYADYRKMFADAKRTGLQAVSIALPNKLHAPVAVAAMKAGLHVLCEKPMATSAAGARQMLAAAKAAKRTLMINFSTRFGREARALKRAIEAGAIGDVYFGRSVWHRRRGIPGLGGWFTNKELAGGGPVMDLGVHRLDLAMWLMGNPRPISVSGSTFDTLGKRLAKEQGKSYEVEDLGCAMIRFDNGATLLLEASWASNGHKEEEMFTQLYGTTGGVVHDNSGDGHAFEARVISETDGSFWNSKMTAAAVDDLSSFHEFVDAVLDNREPISTGQHGLDVQLILDAIYKSAQTGREVRMNTK